MSRARSGQAMRFKFIFKGMLYSGVTSVDLICWYRSGLKSAKSHHLRSYLDSEEG